ncbi:hypothetical protein GCM10007862_15300 [Dyella lipolytica]|uniref:M48 family metallopeptidase n=1 Tax=Dyella lipolytica TaxID=1867835 RepID=A0ABW8ITI1_9GAMM|nr:M48 family metallopeptidase [Dyella lipolytica]GLQ46479.1 hypothetical protein GCM10007862_15300 [Dyella lipolytica]
MDFFAQQARVRGSSRMLVLLFALAVIAMVFAVDVVVLTTFGHHRHGFGRPAPSNSTLMTWTSLIVLAVIAFSALYRIQSLSAGGKAVAESVGGVPVPPDTDDPQLRLLRNVIEEVAIASGTPVPDIYVMQDEPGINAFAAGYSTSDAAICVTQGSLDHLTRDELQGVIAHEFSHVLNGDMRLNIRLMGLLFGIMMLSVIGRQLTWSGASVSTSDDNDGEAGRRVFGFSIGLTILAIGSIGYFFGRLIQAAVARERESLADACAVQFTRQTSGIAGALKKIAVVEGGSQLQVANRHEVAHMMFGDVDEFNDWYATHPPLMKRIRTLEPWFRETELAKVEASMRAVPPDSNTDAAVDSATDTSDKSPKSLPPLEWPGHGDPAAVATQVATAPIIAATIAATATATNATVTATATATAEPKPGTFEHAGALQQSIPASLTDAAKQPESALALTLALAMSAHEDLRQRQCRLIANAFGDDVQFTVGKLQADEATLPASLRMPLVSLSFPALKSLPPGRLQTLLDTLDAVVRVDPQVDLDDYCLARLLRMHLLEALQPKRAPIDGQKKLPTCRDSVLLVCAVVAVYGSDDDAAARRAWLLAMDQAFPGATFTWQTLPFDWQESLDRALADLDGLMPAAKEIVIQSLLSAIQADGVVTPTESELLRVICASLHCPVPPQAEVSAA